VRQKGVIKGLFSSEFVGERLRKGEKEQFFA
jgi:hypothetical protein